MQLTGEEKTTFDRIVAMCAMQVPAVQIAEAVGLSEGRISQIKETDEFKQALAIELAKRLEERQELDDGWDGIEKKAIGIVADNLKWNKNPEFALKAALIANKAVRRNSQFNQPLPTNMGQRVVINLSQTFVQKLKDSSAEEMKTVAAVDVGQGPNGRPQLEGENGAKKVVNLLAPAAVEEMFNGGGVNSLDKLKAAKNEFDFSGSEALIGNSNS